MARRKGDDALMLEAVEPVQRLVSAIQNGDPVAASLLQAAIQLQEAFAAVDLNHRKPGEPDRAEDGSVTVPDLMEAIVGRRCWGLAEPKDSSLLLVSSIGNQTIWPKGEPLQAACSLGKHEAPVKGCRCGIYALSTEDGYEYYDYQGPRFPVWGEVSLWGRIRRGPNGFRAQYAYPKALYLAHKDWRFKARLEEAYGVPVTIRNPYTKEH